MKQLLFLSALFALTLFSCKPGGPKNDVIGNIEIAEGGLLTEIDTARLTLIDSMVFTIDTTANKSNALVTLSPNIHSEQDEVQFFEKDGRLWRCVVTTFQDTFDTRSIFYWKDDKQQFIRHREWRKAPHASPKSKEVLTYFEDGKIIAIVERSKLLGGEPPSALYPVPLEITKRKPSVIVAEYSRYLDPALKTIEAHKREGGGSGTEK